MKKVEIRKVEKLREEVQVYESMKVQFGLAAKRKYQ